MSTPALLLALDLKDKLVLLVGNGEEAVRRLGTLLEHGARLRLVSEQPSPELETLLRASPRVEHLRRSPEEKDLDGVWLAVLADRRSDWVELLGPAAERRRVFFCAIDQPGHNSFGHVGLVRRDWLQIGISTNGRLPGLAGALARELSELLSRSADLPRVLELADKRLQLPAPLRSKTLRSWLTRLRLSGELKFPPETD